MLNHAALPNSRGLSAKLDGNAHLDPLIRRNPGEVDVHDGRAVDVPLQVANESALVDAPFEVHQPAPVPQRSRELLARHGETDSLLAMAIEHCRNGPTPAQPLGMPLPSHVANFDIQDFRHDQPRFDTQP